MSIALQLFRRRGLRIGRRLHTHLCLTDMRLPDGSGMELVETIAREFPSTPVAVLTAFGSTDNAVAALEGRRLRLPVKAGGT